jgi:hypothetical protein
MKPGLIRGIWPGWMVRWSTTFQATKFISDTVQEPSLFTVST